MLKEILFFIGGFVACFILIYLMVRVGRKKRKPDKKISLNTFPKLIVTLVMIHGMVLTTFSYVLSIYDKDPVCSVSEVIVKEILAPVIVYLATNMIMNIFEKNKLAFSEPLSNLHSDDAVG